MVIDLKITVQHIIARERYDFILIVGILILYVNYLFKTPFIVYSYFLYLPENYLNCVLSLSKLEYKVKSDNLPIK